MIISKTLTVVRDTLNVHISQVLRGTGDPIVLAPLTGISGGQTQISTDRIALFVTELSEIELRRGSRASMPPQGGTLPTPAPLQLQLGIVFASGFAPDDYARGLDLIECIARFLHERPDWTAQSDPNLPEGLERLRVMPMSREQAANAVPDSHKSVSSIAYTIDLLAGDSLSSTVQPIVPRTSRPAP